MTKEVELAVRTALAVFLSMVALVDDCRRYRISNKIVITGFMLQLVLLGITMAEGRAWGTYVYGGLVSFAIMTVIYMIGGVGAGDVKLLGVLGACLGFKGGLFLVTGSLCVGVVTGGMEMLWKGCRRTEVAVLGERTLKLHSFHYTIAITITLFLIVLCYWGGVMERA